MAQVTRSCASGHQQLKIEQLLVGQTAPCRGEGVEVIGEVQLLEGFVFFIETIVVPQGGGKLLVNMTGVVVQSFPHRPADDALVEFSREGVYGKNTPEFA